MIFFGCNVLSVNPLKCLSMNNQEYNVRPEMINVTVMNLYFILSVLK